MKILVTGGAGFIGSNLTEELLKRGHSVKVVDNLLTGREKNISHLIKNKNFSFINMGVEDFANENFDFVFHLASPASPRDYQRYALETMRVNSLGTFKMLNLCAQTNSKFLLASTSEIYGDPKSHPQKEDYWGYVNPVGPRSCYDESKRFAESLTVNYINKKNVNARIVRIFNTFGPRMQKDDGRVISNFINQAITGKPITIYGNGNQTRSFCYVTDLVEGLIKAAFSPKTEGQIFNLGNPDERKIREIAELIKTLTSAKSEIAYSSLPQDDPTRRCPDITKAKTFLNWEPKVSLEEGLQKTIEFYKNN